jgi:redox-sensitive bicupin YhaK (pirin superfamily)
MDDCGRGVVHAEMPSAEFMRTGGRMHGFSTLGEPAARDKMMKPRYQEIPSREVPKRHSGDGLVSVSVIAGEAMVREAVIETRTPIIYLHYRSSREAW